ncbi:Girdin [Bagarius yarrelli]|uniref:Girdin n=1 Tax=Bagarius yarrelli TaxID=175774 RepID=A0A556TNL9_BAGYA|nr:Girdin [Bagarius yarrelli]
MDANFTETLEEFMRSALVTWVHLFEDMVGDVGQDYMEVSSNSHNALRQYLRLTDGVYLNEVMRIIDSNPKVEQIYYNIDDDKILRVQNLSILNRHLRSYYQCETKQTFIQQIQSLYIETQAELALCIQEVTQDPNAVLPLQYGDVCSLDRLELQTLLRIAELSVQCESVSSSTAPPTGTWHNTPEGLSTQLVDSKAKLRRLKQELEDKEDQLIDYKQEIQTIEEELKKLQCENRALQGEVRVSRNLRDEVDCLRERANRAEQLQMELKTCMHRLRSMELYRTQLKEQQQYCASLQENKALLEEQLDDARLRCSALRELEKDNLLLRHKLMDMEAERDVERQRVDELLEMNMSLQMDLKRSSHFADVTEREAYSHVLYSELESDEELQETPENHEGDLKPLSVEVNEASSLRLLGAENENAELRRRLECLQAEQKAQQKNCPKLTEALQRQTDRLKQLDEEHQKTLRELQNLKNENTNLKRSLDELEKIETQEKQRERSSGVVERVIPRGECEGKDTGKDEKADKREKRKEKLIRAQREDGEGEEVFLKERKEETNNDIEAKERGEAEGEKWTRIEKNKIESMTPKEVSKSDEQLSVTEKEEEDVRKMEMEVDKLHREMYVLSTQLQQAVDDAGQQANLVQELHSKLGEQKKKTWETEQKLAFLEIESQRLRKAADGLTEARKQIEILQCESMHQEEELMRLRSQAELQKMEAAVIPQLEGERAALERERETLKATIDSLRASVRRGDQLELTNQTLKAELERLGRNLDSARRREEELEAEIKESGLEIEALVKRQDKAMQEVTRLEQEKEVCQSELDSQRREHRQKEREMARLRQQLESTASALEHGTQRAFSLELQHRRECQELSAQLKETCIQVEELKKENQQLNTENAKNSIQITTLTQELSSERLHSQKLSTQVSELNQSLEKLEGKLQMATLQLAQLQAEQARDMSEVTASPCISGTKTENLKSNRQSPVQRESKDEETHFSSEDQITGHVAIASFTADTKNTEELNALRSTFKSESQHSDREKLIRLEKENVVLQKEREGLLLQLAQSQAACSQLREQLDMLQRHSISLQESCSKLQELNTKLQVEQSFLSSQKASMLAQCSEAEVRCTTLEAESKVWQKEKEESAVRYESLRRDHERLTALQQRQEAELEELLAKHSQLKSSNRGLEAQYRDLEARHRELMESKAKLEEAETEIQAERERLERAIQEQADRKKELEYVNQQKEWVQVQSELMAQVSVLRSELSAAQLERTKLEGELNMLKEQNQQLDLNNVRLNSQYQLLTQLKGNMEEENRHLVEQNQSLAKENRALLERSLESRDQHHNQQREYLDKLNELRREKQKLVEKIMDQYRVLEPGMSAPKQPKKSNWIADRMKKLIKPKGGREGRAQFITVGNVDIQEEPGDSVLPSAQTSSAFSQDLNPRSAPSSPATLRRVSSQGETDEPSKVVLRTARRKLGSSRHGWGLGRSRERGVSQSFSPGDHRSRPIHHSSILSIALLEKDQDGSPAPSEEGRDESEENITPEHSDISRVSSGAEGQ